MCKCNSYKPKGQEISAAAPPPPRSVLDNKGTFLQKSIDDTNRANAKNAFYKSHYRIKNLDLAYQLEKYQLDGFEEINKTIRYVRYCSKLSLVSEDSYGNKKIEKVSKRCTHPFCHVCNRAKSQLISNRIISAIEDPENEDLFKNKRWYFLTLTLKHNKETRNGNYLNELRKNMTQLFRSTGFRRHFDTYGAKKNAGAMASIENVIGETSDHIHTHILIVGNNLSIKAAEFQDLISKRWLKITGDSDIVSFDLVKTKSKGSPSAAAADQQNELKKAIKEITKYATKTGSYKKMTERKTKRLANWIMQTKGKNMSSTYGILRGLGITAKKCKYDEKQPDFEKENHVSYLIDKTCKIRYNHATTANYTAEQRKEIFKDIQIKSWSDYSIVVTDVVDAIVFSLKSNIDEAMSMEQLKDHVSQIRDLRFECEGWMTEILNDSDYEDRTKEVTQIQLSLFDDLLNDVEMKYNEFATTM